jgi:PKD repeat protein
VYLYAGQTISGWAAFDAQDYSPFNDNAMVQILDSFGYVIATPWYADVYAVGDFGDGPWTSWSWTAPIDGTFTIEYRVANFGDSEYDSYALFDAAILVFYVSVNNVAPTVDAGPDQTVDEDEMVSFTGYFTDPGWLDTHTIIWDFGDGSPTVAGPLLPDHVYVYPGVYTVTLTVTDDDGGIGIDSLAVTVLDTTPPTTTLSFLGLYHISDHIYISSTATEILLVAEDAEMPYGSGVDIIQYQRDSTDPDGWVTYTVPFTVDVIGTHRVYYRSIDKAGNVETEKWVDVVVNASELTYTGQVEGVYSDPVYLEARLIDIATQLPISGKMIPFEVGSQTTSAPTNPSGYASAIIILDQPCGPYLVWARFDGDEEYLASESDTHDFVIDKETAIVEYTGSTVVPTTAEKMTLRATVFDDDDGYWGDLTKVQVTFRIYTVAAGSLVLYQTWGPYKVTATSVEGVGVFEIEIPNLSDNSYIVIITLDPEDNDYYQSAPSEDAIITVYKPTGDFVTGGGWIWDSEGHKGNFGFNVKYKNNGLPKGQFIYVYRTSDYKFIIKSTAWLGMAIVGNHSFFEAKCVVQQYDLETGELIWSDGNYKIRVDVWGSDKDEGGDVFQIRVYDKIGLIYHEAGIEPYGLLQGGNIVIHISKEE